jgi:hypothetical protein
MKALLNRLFGQKSVLNGNPDVRRVRPQVEGLEERPVTSIRFRGGSILPQGDAQLPKMTARVQSVFDCPPEKVWAELQTSALHREIIRPLIRFSSLDIPGTSERWTQGATYRFRCYLFGVIPFGEHTIFLERIDPVAREIQSREHEALVRHWDHLIVIRPTPDGRTLYSDEIEISAGLLTPLVWAFAHWFYRHRQRRWRRIARRLTASICQR